LSGITSRALIRGVGTPERLQAGTTVELDALLPAIVDRAFKGELRNPS
jgi:hypothetical protein